LAYLRGLLVLETPGTLAPVAGLGATWFRTDSECVDTGSDECYFALVSREARQAGLAGMNVLRREDPWVLESRGENLERLKNFDKLRPEVRKLIEPYVRSLFTLLKEDVLSIVVFGSATGPDFVPGRSNVNLAVVVKEIDLSLLKKCLKQVSAGAKKGIVAPLFLTQEYINSSADVFPVEFLDIRETGVTLMGEEPLANVQLSRSGLRLECEQQLKGSLLRIRQAYLELGLQKAGLETVLCDSLTSLIPVFRAMLVLKEQEVVRGKRQILESVCGAFGLPADTFLSILKLKLEKKRVSPEKGEKLLGDYMRHVRDMARLVDALSISGDK